MRHETKQYSTKYLPLPDGNTLYFALGAPLGIWVAHRILFFAANCTNMNRFSRYANLVLTLRIFVIVAVSVFCSGQARATPEKAAGFYEDALKRFENDDLPGAIVQLKNSLQQDNKLLAAHLLLGKVLFRSGQLPAAEAALEEAVKQGINRGEVALPLGQIYLASGSPMRVIDRLSATGVPPGLAIEILTLRGVAYAELGNTRMAAQTFEQARALDPKSAIPVVAEVPGVLASGDLARAKSLAAKGIELAPDDANAWNMQGSVLHASLDLPGALKAYDKTLQLQPKFIDARVARAALLADLKRDPEAEKDLEFLRVAKLSDPRASYLSALLASRRDDQPAVTRALGEVAKQVDALPIAWVSGREQLIMVAALSHHGLRNFEKAREYLDVIVRRYPKNIGARKLLASIHVERRDIARALPLLEALQQILPDDPQVQYMLGSAYMAQRRYALAAGHLERAATKTGSSTMNRALGLNQLGLGQIEAGTASLEKAYAANTADSVTGTALATVYMRNGQSKKALQVAEAMSKQSPENLALASLVASIKEAAGDRAGARAAYAAIFAKDATFQSATLNLARMDVTERKFEDGRRRLGELLTKRADHPDALYELGILEQRAGRIDDAIRHFKKASEAKRRDMRPGIALVDLYIGQLQGDNAVAAAKELAAKIPDNLAVQVALARGFIAAGDLGNARSVLQGATRLADFDATVQVGIGKLQLVAGNIEGAQYNAQKALQGRPDDPSALALMLEIELRRGGGPRADAALKALTSRHPNDIESLQATALVAMERGQFANAGATYRAVLAREETTANALNVVKAHVSAGEFAKAAAFLQAWLKPRPEDRLATKALAEVQFRAGQLEAARGTYALVLAAEPNDAQTHNSLANLLQKMNDPAAQSHAERALKLAPSNPAYADTLGWIHVQNGQIEAGLRYLREARLRRPADGELRYHLAYALAKMGRASEARTELAAALTVAKRVPLSPEVVRLQQELGIKQ